MSLEPLEAQARMHVVVFMFPFGQLMMALFPGSFCFNRTVLRTLADRNGKIWIESFVKKFLIVSVNILSLK